MKNTTKKLLLTALLGSTLQLQAAGTISGPGYYYQALPVGATGTYENIFLKGDYPDMSTCNSARSADYDPGDGIVPWDGGPGCHYIHENDVDNANELYSVAFNPGTDGIISLDAELQQLYFEQLDQLDEEHDIRNYKIKVNELLNQFRQQAPRR
jgi:hypothetical protein